MRDCRMTNNDTRIELVTTVTPEHWDLLLSADPSKKLVQNYLQSGMLFARSKDGHPIAVMVLQELTSDKLEIKNIAVDPRLENHGIATRLLQDAVHFAKVHHYQQLQIGTGSTSFKQLYLYQKIGFRVTEIKKNFFVKNYGQPIHENGLLLRDMLVLTLAISDYYS